MNKKYLLEQCKRLQFITNDENMLWCRPVSDEWNLNHNKGHETLCNKFMEFIKFKKITNKEATKWLNLKIKKSDKIINSLDVKYKFFVHNEEMTNEENFIYSSNDGQICQALTLKNVINKKHYFSKDSYVPTDWKAKELC
ncbi:transporter [Clostridium algidicarnis]|uniref:transporter n=1 Tax=Clostridium algidicarnis TaxID=37659 RepID=UPI003FD85566